MKYFTIEELSYSNRAKELGLDNEPGYVERANLNNLVDKVLDPLREAWGKPITVTSGYRCERLNKVLGGAARSHHMRGMAADIMSRWEPGVTDADRLNRNRRLFELIQELQLPFTQLIWEKGTELGPQWIHVSLDRANVRKEILWLK